MQVSAIEIKYNGGQNFSLPFTTPQGENAAIRVARKQCRVLCGLENEPIVQPTTRNTLILLKHPGTRARIAELVLKPAPKPIE